METSDYTVSITVKANAEQAFKSINSVSKWWTEHVEGRTEKLNDEFIVRSGDVHYSKHKIIEVIPNKKVVWLVTDSKLNWIENNKDEWTNTKMVFDINPNGDNTTITFTHLGLTPGQECYDNCVKGWDSIIKQNLYKFVTTGEIVKSKVPS
jgi:hypothetical protein